MDEYPEIDSVEPSLIYSTDVPVNSANTDSDDYPQIDEDRDTHIFRAIYEFDAYALVINPETDFEKEPDSMTVDWAVLVYDSPDSVDANSKNGGPFSSPEKAVEYARKVQSELQQ